MNDLPLPPSRAASQRILIVTCVVNVALPTNGTTGAAYVELPAEFQEQIEPLGPYLVGITAYTNTLGRTTNHAWNCVFWTSFDGKTWSGPTSLFAAVTANGAVVQTQYTTTSNFHLHMRYALGVQNSAGTAMESANVSLTLVFELKT